MPRHAAANAHREVVAARKQPQIALETPQELYPDGVRMRWCEVAERHLQVVGPERPRIGEQRVARSVGQHNESGGMFGATGSQAHPLAGGLHLRHPRAHYPTAGGSCAIEQQAVEHDSGVDHDRLIEGEPHPVATAGDQFNGADQFLGVRSVEQEGISLNGLVSEAAAAGFLPGQMLVEQRNFEPEPRQPFPTDGPRWAPTNNRYVPHACTLVTHRFLGHGSDAWPWKLVTSTEKRPQKTRQSV